MEGYFPISKAVTATAHKQMNNETVKKLWHGFLCTQGTLEIIPSEQLIFRIGSTPLPILEDKKEYAIAIDENGVAVVGRDYGSLMRGFFVLLMKIELLDNAFYIKYTSEQSRYIIRNRMIHICVFPENDLYFIKKLIRLSALCQYTHIVIEFWGTLRYDAMKELAWPHAFTKEQAKELIQECKELGIEPVPMFNMLGHAPASRVRYGKHVVLDQNPKLQYLFTPDGWAWNVALPEVKTLLKNIRQELYALFGDGSYFHIGLDEAYLYSQDPALRKQLPDILREFTTAVETEGRRPLVWMDMFLEKDTFKDCYAVGEKDEVETIRNAAAKSSVFIDWQYGCFDVPIPSLVSLKDCGKDVMGAPWFKPENYSAHVHTVAENDLFGIMLTTWNGLKENTHHILGCAKECGAVTFPWSKYTILWTETATILRNVSFEGNTYADSGWTREQIEP